jgi:small conductance mechanosensitive channel
MLGAPLKIALIVVAAAIANRLVRLVVKTQPSKQWEVSRLIRERIKAAFDERGIEVPFPQQTVWMRMENSGQGVHAGQLS